VNTYQAIAALVYRLAAVALFIYAVTSGVLVFFMMPRMALAVVPYLLIAIALFVYAIPLAKLTAGDIVVEKR
jgi:hypothetical protein